MLELDGYKVETRLGAGSQGETFGAIEEATGRRVAIKRLRMAEVPDWKAVELFEREGQALAGLHHPGMANQLGTFARPAPGGGEDFFLIQEHIDGESLDRGLERGERWSVEDLRAFLVSLATTLAYLHGRLPPIVHRDLKPSNIMRRKTGESPYVLIDFGALQVMTPLVREEGGSTIVGTSGYMPPEQLLGRALPSSDLYALGATAAHLLTGVHPSRLPLSRLRIDWRSALPRGLVVPKSLASILDRLLAPAVEDRFQSAEEVLEALRSETASPAPTRPNRPAERKTPSGAPVAEGGRPRRAIWWAVGVLSIAAIMGVSIRSELANAALEEAYRDAVAARQEHVERWRASTRLLPTIQDLESDEAFTRMQSMGTYDPGSHRMDAARVVERVSFRSRPDIDQLLAFGRLPEIAKSALSNWLAAEAQLEPAVRAMAEYLNDGWKDDKRAAQRDLWREVELKLEARREALGRVRKEVLPAVLGAIRDLQRGHEASHGRDEVWWLIDVWFGAHMLVDEVLASSGSRSDGVVEYDLVASRSRLLGLLEAAPAELKKSTRPLARRLEQAGAYGNRSAGEISEINSANLRLDMLDFDKTPMLPALPPRPSD